MTQGPTSTWPLCVVCGKSAREGNHATDLGAGHDYVPGNLSEGTKNPIQTFYSDRMCAYSDASPSAAKPQMVAKALVDAQLPVVFVEPEPVTVDDLCLAHDRDFVLDVLALRRANGFGSRSRAVARSLPYTTGAMLGAARAALATGRNCAALCSGFHHAGYAQAGGFCTFNGLMVAALSLCWADSDSPFTARPARVAIIDADQHYGDGTQDILDTEDLVDDKPIFHYSFGGDFHKPSDAPAYLAKMQSLEDDLRYFRPDVIIYQAGADAHRDDPLGGVLTTDQLLARDVILFGVARRLGVPVAWNLAGGYQSEADGSIPKVIEIHLNTFRAALRQEADDG